MAARPAGDALDLDELAVVLGGEGAAGAGQPAGRQDVIGSRRVVAGGLGRVRPDEERARVSQPRHGLLDIVHDHGEVLRGVAVDEASAASRFGASTTSAPFPERPLQDLAPRGRLELARQLRLDGRGEGRVPGDEQGRGVGAVLGLREQVGGHVHGIGGAVRDDHHFRRAGGQVDAALAEDLELGGRDPGVARADDAVHRRDTGLRESVGHRPDGLRAAGDDEGVHADESGGAQQRLVEPPSASAGEATTIVPTPATFAGTTPISSELGYAAEPPGA
jgi:hypothetical protein